MIPRKSNSVERRSFPFHVRAAESQQGKTLEGYAAVFSRETVLIPKDAMWNGSPEIREVIEPGAFAKTLREADQAAFWNHNSDIVLGSTKSSTVSLSEDAKGLRSVITPPDTALIRDMVITPIERGDVNQMSFGFSIVRENREDNADGSITFRLKEVKLYEVSPVALPAYTDTEISARSQERIDDCFRQLRQAAGISAPSESAHPEQPEQVATPTEAHPENSAPSSRHLDQALVLALELEQAA